MHDFDGSILRRGLSSLVEHPFLLVSFSIYKGLSSLLFFLEPALPSAVPAFLGHATSATCICVAIVLCCVFFAATGRKLAVFNSPRYLAPMASALIVGVLCLCYVTPYITLPLPQLVCWAGALLLTCAGACSIHIEFGRLMGYLGSTYTLIFNAGCSFTGLPITVALLLMPTLARAILSSALVVAMIYTFARSLYAIGKEEVYDVSDAELSIPWRFLGTSFAQGVAIGLTVTLFSRSSAMGLSLVVVSVCLAATAALLFGLVMRVDFDTLVYRIGFCAIGFGCTLFTLAPAGGFASQLPQFALFVAYVFLDIVLWSLGSHLIKSCNQPAIWVAACPSASLMTGRIVGSVLGALRLGGAIDADNAHEMLAFAAVATFMFMGAAVLMSSSNNLRSGWGFIKLTDENVHTEREWACKLIAEDFHLTERERDVLELLALGMSRSDIADALVVAPNTVKTHIRNIYAKLDVHSNAELLKFVAHQQRAFEAH